MIKKIRPNLLKLRKRSFLLCLIAAIITAPGNPKTLANVTDIATSLLAKNGSNNASKIQNVPGEQIIFEARFTNTNKEEAREFQGILNFKSVINHLVFEDKAGGTIKNGMLFFPEILIPPGKTYTKKIVTKVRSDISGSVVGNVYFGNSGIPIAIHKKEEIKLTLDDMKISGSLKIINESDGTNPITEPVDIGEVVRVEAKISIAENNPVALENYYVKVYTENVKEHGEIIQISSDGKEESDCISFGPINHKNFCPLEKTFFFKVKVNKRSPKFGTARFMGQKKDYPVRQISPAKPKKVAYKKPKVYFLPKTGPGLDFSLVLSLFLGLGFSLFVYRNS